MKNQGLSTAFKAILTFAAMAASVGLSHSAAQADEFEKLRSGLHWGHRCGSESKNLGDCVAAEDDRLDERMQVPTGAATRSKQNFEKGSVVAFTSGNAAFDSFGSFKSARSSFLAAGGQCS